MLKTHKQNLVPESDFHNREERVKAQQSESEGKTTTSSKLQGEKEGSLEASREEKQGKSSKSRHPIAEESTTSKMVSKTKSGSGSPSDSNNSREQLSGSGRDANNKGASSQKDKEREKERGGKIDMKDKSKERASSEEKKEKAAAGKEQSDPPLKDGSPSELEVSSLAAAKAGKSPVIHNGPMGRGGSSSPARAGQRRQHSGEAASPDPAAERGVCKCGCGMYIGDSCILVVVCCLYVCDRKLLEPRVRRLSTTLHADAKRRKLDENEKVGLLYEVCTHSGDILCLWLVCIIITSSHLPLLFQPKLEDSQADSDPEMDQTSSEKKDKTRKRVSAFCTHAAVSYLHYIAMTMFTGMVF